MSIGDPNYSLQMHAKTYTCINITNKEDIARKRFTLFSFLFFSLVVFVPNGLRIEHFTGIHADGPPFFAFCGQWFTARSK